MVNRNLPRPPIRITPAFGFSYITERALREGLGRRQFGLSEMDQVVKWFERYETQPCCAFCGRVYIRRWDHLIPIRNDGETVVGNMVLACQTCDDSKGKSPFLEWMTGTASKSPQTRNVAGVKERAGRLEAYMKAFHYSPIRLELRLNRNERARLSRIKTELEQLRR